jgi:hypothetical protein
MISPIETLEVEIPNELRILAPVPHFSRQHDRLFKVLRMVDLS